MKTLAELFEMNVAALCKLAKDFQDFNREEALKLLFPNQEISRPSRKIMISKLSVEDKLLHFTIVKCITLRSSNTTNIVKDEFFCCGPLRRDIP